MAYIKTFKEQNWLLPPSIRELIPKDYVCFLVEDFVNSLNFSNFDLIYDGVRYQYRGLYTRKNGRKIHFFYNAEIKKKKDVPYYFRERLRMKEKMKSEEGKKVYSLRKISVEPVYGNMKQNLGFREFLLRGLPKVKIEFNLLCIAHNLQKIWKLRRVSEC